MTHPRKPATSSTSTVRTLEANELRHIRGGDDSSASNVLKTRHDTVKNTISNIR